MPYIQGTDRNQLTLTPMCLDDFVDENSICRVIEAYVLSLDTVSLGFKYSNTKETGRPPFNPANMLMLYVYGYMNRVRSSRRLEAEARRNVEVMWLMEGLTPDDRTICNFRKDNAVALKKAFREFSLWCNKQDLYGKNLVAVDGTKPRANTSSKNIYIKKVTEKRLAETDKKIEKYMKELEKNDADEINEPRLSDKAVKETLAYLKAKKSTLEERLELIENNNSNEVSVVDPDARIMHQGGDGKSFNACYNVQTVADDKHNLIVDFEVSSLADDKGALPQMTESAKEIMGVEEIAVVADKGYYNANDIDECEANNTTCYIPAVRRAGPNAPDESYDRENFKYDRNNDCYICPQGERLYFSKKLNRGKNGDFEKHYENSDACANCENRSKCTKNNNGRKLIRSSKRDILEIVDHRMKTDEAREIYRKRQEIIEHPFGTTKKIWGFNQFLCRTKEKTTAEQSLVFLAYNLRRVINIFKENDKDLLAVMAL
jgi:transposase